MRVVRILVPNQHCVCTKINQRCIFLLVCRPICILLLLPRLVSLIKHIVFGRHSVPFQLCVDLRCNKTIFQVGQPTLENHCNVITIWRFIIFKSEVFESEGVDTLPLNCSFNGLYFSDRTIYPENTFNWIPGLQKLDTSADYGRNSNLTTVTEINL